MHLTRITASIALVAYLLGGWLTPALHDHAAHGEHSVCEHAHAADSSHPVHGSHATPSCSHDSSLQEQPAAATAASLDQHSPLDVCDGLCVLCHISTREFTATAVDGVCCTSAGPTQRLTLVDQPLCRSLRLLIDGPRGPPARLG